jgi:TM2 domain-containing membrane protein YozV
MSLTEKSMNFTLDFPKEKVINSTLKVVEKMKGFKVKSENKLAGIITISTGVSATSWGENVIIKCEDDNGKTKVTVSSESKTGIMAGGAMTPKNTQNVNLILENITNDLQGLEIKTKGGSNKSALITLILLFLLGVFGVHKFYLGKIGWGVIYLLTFGLFGIGVLVDFFRLIMGNLQDSEGNEVTSW